MDNQCVHDLVVEILSSVNSQGLLEGENLFGAKNGFTPRDMAYVLLELEKRVEINIDHLVRFVDKTVAGYTIGTLVDAVLEQKRDK